MKTKINIISLLLLTLILIIPKQNIAKDNNINELKKGLPKLLGASNIGRDYYFTFLPCWQTSGTENGLKIYISAGIRTKVTVEIEGKDYKKSLYTIPYEVVEFDLTIAQGQCYTKSESIPPESEKVYRGYGIHVYSEDPIICYGVTEYSYSSDGFLALPVWALGNEYIVASWGDFGNNTNTYSPSYTGIVAPYKGTKVYFTLGGNGWTKTAGGMKPGETKSWTLDKGDVLLIGSSGSHGDLTGSRIVSSKPVAVISGNYCANIPINLTPCDFIMEQELPTKLWGTEYHVTTINKRKYNSYIRIFAKEPSTLIYRDGLALGMIKNVGGIEGDGYLSMRADDGSPRPIVISSDKPCSVTQYTTGSREDNSGIDPFQMVLLPYEQYENDIVFNPPAASGGASSGSNFINLVYEVNSQGVIPEELMFGEVVNGEYKWKKLKSIDPTLGEEFRVKINGKRLYQKTLTLQHSGIFRISNSTPICAYSYGTIKSGTYGYPAYANLKDLTKKDFMPPVPRWMSDSNGNIGDYYDASIKDMPDDEENRSNLCEIYLHTDISYNYVLEHGDFMPGEDRETYWRLTRPDKNEDSRAVITFSDCAGNDTTIAYDYNALKLAIRPQIIDFGRLAVGEEKEYDLWVINESQTSSALLNYVRLKNYWDQDFEIYGINLPVTIPIGDSVKFKVRFTATIEGFFKDSIGVGDTSYFWYKAYVEARVGVPIISTSDLNFGDLYVNNEKWETFDLKNEGTVDLIITGVKGPFTKAFSIKDLGEISESTPLKLKPKELIDFTIVFKPSQDKIYRDSIVFISNSFKEGVDSVAVLEGRGLTMSIIEESDNKIALYPNPADEILYISLNNKEISGAWAIKIYDILGNVAMEKNAVHETDKGWFVLNTTQLSHGLYFLKINTSEQVIIRKIAIVH